MIINQETIGHKFKRKTEKDSLVSSSSLAMVMRTGHKLSFNTPSKSGLQLLCIIWALQRVTASQLQHTSESGLLRGYSDNAFFPQYKGSLNTNAQVTAWKWAQLSHFFINCASFCLQERAGSKCFRALHFCWCSPPACPAREACSVSLACIKTGMKHMPNCMG